MRERLAHLVWGLGATALLLLVCVPAGWLLRGGSGAAGVAAGIGVVAASYALSSLVIAWADLVHRPLILPLGLITYSTKFTLIGLLMAAISAAGWPGLAPMGVGVVVGVVGWNAAQVWWLSRNQPVPPPPPEDLSEAAPAPLPAPSGDPR